MLSKISTLLLKASNLNHSVSFYTDFLGLKVDFEIEGFVVFKTSGICFGMEQAKPGEPVGSGTNVNFELEDGVDELYFKLKNKGVEFIQSPRNMDWGGRQALLADPDGYIIGFYEMLGPLCESCGMPMNTVKKRGGGIEDNPYCVYCCDEKGELKSRAVIRESMIKFYIEQKGKGRKEAETAVDSLMKWLPAWRDS